MQFEALALRAENVVELALDHVAESGGKLVARADGPRYGLRRSKLRLRLGCCHAEARDALARTHLRSTVIEGTLTLCELSASVSVLARSLVGLHICRVLLLPRLKGRLHRLLHAAHPIGLGRLLKAHIWSLELLLSLVWLAATLHRIMSAGRMGESAAGSSAATRLRSEATRCVRLVAIEATTTAT